ncbi:MAG: hypothetical protein E7622_00140 [Ruminococcaceae bacterium]|nr:hypothetical protein [Oscillospiraceae bacterium]
MDKLGEKIGFFAFFFTVMTISSSPHPFMLALCYAFHELGHIFFAKIQKIPVKKLRVGSFRLSISYDCSAVSYKRELLVCAGGVIFNLLGAIIGAIFLPNGSESASFFTMCSLSLALMNIYPISTLDGGRIFRCIFLIIFDEERAQRICKWLSFVSAFILWLCAVYAQMVFNSNVSLFFISVFLLVELCLSK